MTKEGASYKSRIFSGSAVTLRSVSHTENGRAKRHVGPVELYGLFAGALFGAGPFSSSMQSTGGAPLVLTADY